MNEALSTTSGKIIILNGPSSSGKTTLALALQNQIDLPFIRFSFDLFLEYHAFPMEQVKKGRFSWEAMRPGVFRGIQECVPALAAAGNNVIFDHIIETRAWLQHLVSILAAFDVFFVGLHCSLPELERREIQRRNRRPGEARMDFQTVHTITSYDLELDSEQPLEDNVISLIQAWHARQRPNALDRMIQELNGQSTSDSPSLRR